MTNTKLLAFAFLNGAYLSQGSAFAGCVPMWAFEGRHLFRNDRTGTGFDRVSATAPAGCKGKQQ
jgi:hypothetical protein